MKDLDAVDYFTDQSLVNDPYPYFEHLRARCPVAHEPSQGTFAVTGYDEVVEVYRNTDDFSSCNSVIGPFVPLPAKPEGDDICDFIRDHRDQLPMSEHLATMDPPDHTKHRALMMRLITPRRLKENEEFMWRLADHQLDEFVDRGRCEFIKDYSQPFALLVVADLLGIPESDHDLLRRHLGYQRPGDMAGRDDHQWEMQNPLEFLDDFFVSYIEDRRRKPRNDVLTDLATAKFPDGSTPDVIDVVRIATFMFGAGQETTARLLGAALRIIAEYPDLQERLRRERDIIPAFVEEVLRYESPVKSDFRLARRSTRIGEVEVPAGATVTLLNGAANRDPRHFDHPGDFRLDRANAKEHLAFGRGIHSCPGGPLARAEGRIGLERILDRMGDVGISEEHHGPPGDRRYEFEPTYILRGLNSLHLEFTPLPGTGRD